MRNIPVLYIMPVLVPLIWQWLGFHGLVAGSFLLCLPSISLFTLLLMPGWVHTPAEGYTLSTCMHLNVYLFI